eukprot:Transcript_10250.p3 GENE.Transcript_10250~~Transcript_10250.p3  ORF type:complete len:218 (-),score=90.55 Transcript_10250:1242-1895(-)
MGETSLEVPVAIAGGVAVVGILALGCQTKNGKLWAWLFPGHAKLKRAGAQKEPRAERASGGLDPAEKARRRAIKSQRQQDAKASKAAAEQAEREEAALLQSMVAQNLQSAKDAAKAEELQRQELEYDEVKERERALAVARELDAEERGRAAAVKQAEVAELEEAMVRSLLDSTGRQAGAPAPAAAAPKNGKGGKGKTRAGRASGARGAGAARGGDGA